MKVNSDVFRGYKQTSKVCFVYLECKLQPDVCRMYIQVELPQKGTKTIFSDKQRTTKVPLMFLDV